MKRTILFLCCLTAFTLCNAQQSEVEAIMNKWMNEFGAVEIQTVIMETKTGEIKAKVGSGFNINHRSRTVALPILIGALDDGKVKLSDKVNTNEGLLIVNNDTIKDTSYHKGGYGEITVEKGFILNSGISNYEVIAKTFGGNCQEELKKLGYKAACSEYGQWADVSTMQTLAFMNSIANDKINASPETVKAVKSVLRKYVTEGLGMKANSGKVEISGMSATTKQEDGSWWIEFYGYFPSSNPKYTMIVTMKKNEIPASGGAMCGVVFKEIAEKIIE